MIRIDRLTKFYEDGSVLALHEMSFSVHSGEILALMGPSGCGKSTLLNLIGSLDRPDSGAIYVHGKPIQDYRPFRHYRNRMVGFVFQFHHLLPSLTLMENVMLPMFTRKMADSERKRKASELLAATGLKHRMHFYPARVSGGERQRAAIARALVNEPRIILADEPTGSIDSHTGDKVISFLIDYCLARSITLIMATHNQRVANMAQRILFMRDGRIEEAPVSL